MAVLGTALSEMGEMIAVMFHKVRNGGNKLLGPINRDGTVPAFFRQGADEIGMALKAFPDSVHVEEPGTVLNPTQGEIAARRTPRSQVYGHAPKQAKSGKPTPSQIAKDKRAKVAEKDKGHERQDDGNSR